MKPEHFEVLRKVEKNPESTQRELAKELGLSLGKLNYCLKALKDKGYKIFAFAGSAKKKELKKIEDLKIGYTDYSVSNARFNILNEFYVMFKLLFNLRSLFTKIFRPLGLFKIFVIVP